MGASVFRRTKTSLLLAPIHLKITCSTYAYLPEHDALFIRCHSSVIFTHTHNIYLPQNEPSNRTSYAKHKSNPTISPHKRHGACGELNIGILCAASAVVRTRTTDTYIYIFTHNTNAHAHTFGECVFGDAR